ncbi:tetratricopeptide repeat protein [Erythrobacter tepidarius]|uniref:tetratricopeptide repeat protein n=1 Tax=Erythrobacter tepidarius TaxID=60454 RepID=UPI001FE8CD15|nr:tetratricopeptide repeat protein [Erythrobacter tepidarius]
MSLLLALLLQVGPDPTGGAMPDDDLVRSRPARRDRAEQEVVSPTSAWLQTCLDQLAADPARAHTMAQIRRQETSGADRVLANHCLGTAASALGRWEDARIAFLAAHDETPQGEPRARARFAALAGNAALAGGDAAGAVGLLTQAEAEARAAGSAPLEAIAAIDRARALVSLGRSEEGLAALDAATARAPENAEGWLLKATLLRRLDRLGLAQQAIEAAAKLTPTNPEVGLEAGVIAVLSGRDEAARASWQSVLNLQPESRAATLARDYLAQLGPPPETPAPAQPAPEEQEPPV